jgi:hypothetical protein
MARSSLTAPVIGDAPDRRPLRRSTTAVIQLVTTSLLVVAIVMAGLGISISIARAQVVGAMHEPDMGLVLTLRPLDRGGALRGPFAPLSCLSRRRCWRLPAPLSSEFEQSTA